jgi:predicted ATP-grasp superfamily ATP-dependent carboligase
MTAIVVAALSARMIAQAAALDGFEVLALDLFGDLDTRHASARWLPIGEPDRLQIDGDRLLAALGELAQWPDVAGWIIGSGFDGCPDLLARGAEMLPLIGTQPDAVRRVREPRGFFAFLDSHGITHPRVQMTAPDDLAGWLVKDSGGSGGWHIQRASMAKTISDRHYFQVEMNGTPMSATFIANGTGACVLGYNELLVWPVMRPARRPYAVGGATRPFVFYGAIGPVPVSRDADERITDAVRQLASEFSLRGLCSLDFIFDGGRIGVLEVNPRVPASIALYGAKTSGSASQGIVAAHVNACLLDELPERREQSFDIVHGTEIVVARHSFSLDERAADLLARSADCHDLPGAATQFDVGDPVCSVSASGRSPEQVRASLERSREAVQQMIETRR